jgi:hypothetical protein
MYKYASFRKFPTDDSYGDAYSEGTVSHLSLQQVPVSSLASREYVADWFHFVVATLLDLFIVRYSKIESKTSIAISGSFLIDRYLFSWVRYIEYYETEFRISTVVLRRYLDQRGMKRQEVGENCIMRSFITCTLLQV